MEFQDVWQCHECNRILGPDDLGIYHDYPDWTSAYVEISKCIHCESTNVDRFDAADLCKELARIRRTDCKYTRGNLEQIQIILEQVFEL